MQQFDRRRPEHRCLGGLGGQGVALRLRHRGIEGEVAVLLVDGPVGAEGVQQAQASERPDGLIELAVGERGRQIAVGTVPGEAGDQAVQLLGNEQFTREGGGGEPAEQPQDRAGFGYPASGRQVEGQFAHGCERLKLWCAGAWHPTSCGIAVQQGLVVAVRVGVHHRLRRRAGVKVVSGDAQGEGMATESVGQVVGLLRGPGGCPTVAS